jgi:hypothetical protein
VFVIDETDPNYGNLNITYLPKPEGGYTGSSFQVQRDIRATYTYDSYDPHSSALKFVSDQEGFEPQSGEHLKCDNSKFKLDLLWDPDQHGFVNVNVAINLVFHPQAQISVSIQPDWFVQSVEQLLKPYVDGLRQQTHRLSGRSRLGLSWDAVANMINTRLREEGIGLLAELSQTKKFRFRHLLTNFRILNMSYNFQVLLGFYGSTFDPDNPLESKALVYNEHYTNAPVDPITNFEILTEVENNHHVIYLPILLEDEEQYIHGVIPYKITTTEKAYPPVYRLLFTIDTWEQDNYKGWFKINPTTGTIQMVYLKMPSGLKNPVSAIVCVELYQGDNASPLFEKQVKVYGCHGDNEDVPNNWTLRSPKDKIVFDEKIRVGIELPSDTTQPTSQNFNSIKNIQWSLSDKRYLRFTSAVDTEGHGIDDGRTVMVQALHQVTSDVGPKPNVKASVTLSTGNIIQLSIPIDVMSDQVEYKAQVIEAPYVGVSLSTPQLFLLTNIGYQMFKNSMLTPRQLDSVQVASVLQNTFSPGMYMSGQGDFPITMNDADSSNLTFTLCDANYHPIKLLSPMWVILKVDPAPNPTEDISQWNQLLPRVRKPQINPILYQVPRININQHPNLFQAWMTSTGIV